MENTLENKAKFFAQYYGQPVAVCSIFKDKSSNEDKLIGGTVGEGFATPHSLTLKHLSIKPLSSITDEDANVCLGFIWKYSISRLTNIRYVLNSISDSHSALPIGVVIMIVDYLRSKGYALPYMGLSVEQQIEYGWVRLA